MEKKESIWNRIGNNNNNNNNNNNKTSTIKQQKQKQPNEQQQLPAAATTTRASFSFDHYIHSLETKKTQSRFIPTDIINGLFNNKSNETKRVSVDQPSNSKHLLTIPDHPSSSTTPQTLLDQQQQQPWSTSETFTHQINPTRPTLPIKKSNQSRIPIIPSNNNHNKPSSSITPSNFTLTPNTPSPTQQQQPSPRSRSHSVFSIFTTTTTTTQQSSALRSPNNTRTIPTGGLRQQIQARRTLLLTSPTSPIQPINQSNQHDIHFHHTSPQSKPQQQQQHQSISVTDTETISQPTHNISCRSRSLSDTFIRKTQSFTAIHPHTHPRYSLHNPPHSPNLLTVLPSQFTKEIILKHSEPHKHKHGSSCTSPIQPTGGTQHYAPDFNPIHTPQDILNLFESQPLNPISNPTRGHSEIDGDESDENDHTLHLIDNPQARDALNVKADFVIAVAGPKGVGKSTIITKALRHTQWGSSVVIYEDSSENHITSSISNITSNTTGNVKILQVLEIDQPILHEKFVKKNHKEGISWPDQLPHPDGVLLCYDAMDPDALDQLRPLLHAFWTRGGISLIVLACKSDKDEKKNATSPLKAAELVNVYGTGMIQLDGGLDDPSKKMRNSFNWILKAIKEARGEHRPHSSASSTNILDSMCGDDAPPLSSSITAAHLLPVGSETSEELDQESPRGSCTPFTPGKLASDGQPLTSPGMTPRRPTPASLDLFSDSTHLVPPLQTKSSKFHSHTHTDDADGDSFSNNALVAMSYEKSTRPDGSFKDDGSTSGSSQDSVLKALSHTPAIQTASPTANHPDHKYGSNQPSNDDQEDQSLPAQSDQTSSGKALSGPKKHAVQKAIAMSQRGVDMDLHFDKQVIIDKFVFATVSGNEPSFVDQFLIIFRRFATPFEVLSALIFRFEFVSQHIERDPLLGRYAHLKIGHVLMSWLETYPGDFVHPSTLTTLKAFNSLMISVTWLLHYAMEIIPIIKMLGRMTDEDVGWALPDTTDESAIKSVLECLHNLERSLAPPSSSALRGSVADNPNEELVPPTTPLTTGKSIDGSMTYPPSDTSPHHETFASTFTSNDHLASTAASSPVHSFSPHDRPAKWTEEHRANDILHHPLASLDPSEHFIASTLPLKSTLTTSSFSLPDNKVELKALLDASLFLLSIPEEAIALQITRLEWNIFSHMKPRHLIRYVLAPRDPNNPRKALRDPNSPIAKSTDYLNYLAVWASSMILIHDKLKSRARVLLKLMKVAYELRDMDDFHSLMGVLAGIEAQPVYRLDATFEIVQHMDLQSYRRYLSLKKLMSSQRSFSAYRLARQTASSQCVPYLGTYLQDITAVNEVKDDMKDGKVNLTKMVQIAKSASSVLNCNLLAPKIVFDPKISNLIMKVPVLSEDAQYELSYKYKPRLPTSNHHHSTTPIVNGSNGGSHSGMGGLMSAITAAAAATTGVGSGSGSIGVHGGRQSASGCETGKLSSSVSSGSLLAPFPLDPAPLLLQSCTSAPPSSDSRPHPPSPPPPPPPHPNPNPPLLPPTAPTPSSSLATSLPIGVLSTPSLVAKKGTRKLKHFLSTAISSSSSHSSHPPSNSNGHHHLSLPHH